MREALLFVIVVAMVQPACGCSWQGCFSESETNIRHVVSQLADRFGWRPVVEDFVAPSWASKKVE